MPQLSDGTTVTTLAGTELVPVVTTPGQVGGNAKITATNFAAAAPFSLGYAPVGWGRNRAFVSGSYYTAGPFVSSTFAQGDGLLTATPFWVPVACSVDRIACDVTATAASSVVRLGIYGSTGQIPGPLILDAGTVDSAGSTGVKELTISQALPAGLVWLVAVAQGGAPTLRTIGTGYLPEVGMSTSTQGANMTNGFRSTGVAGALAGTLVVGTPLIQAYRILVRAA